MNELIWLGRTVEGNHRIVSCKCKSGPDWFGATKLVQLMYQAMTKEFCVINCGSVAPKKG